MDSFNLLHTPCYYPIVRGTKPEICSQVYQGDGKGTQPHASAADIDSRKQGSMAMQEGKTPVLKAQLCLQSIG